MTYNEENLIVISLLMVFERLHKRKLQKPAFIDQITNYDATPCCILAQECSRASDA